MKKITHPDHKWGVGVNPYGQPDHKIPVFYGSPKQVAQKCSNHDIFQGTWIDLIWPRWDTRRRANNILLPNCASFGFPWLLKKKLWKNHPEVIADVCLVAQAGLVSEVHEALLPSYLVHLIYERPDSYLIGCFLLDLIFRLQITCLWTFALI